MSKRKTYKPKSVNLNPLVKLARIQVSKEPVTDEYAAHFELAAHTALDAFAHGRATRKEWDSLANVMNVAYTLAENGIGAEVLPEILTARGAMGRVRDRFKAGKGLVFDGEGLQAVRFAVGLWCDQLRLCNVGEIDAAVRLVDNEYWRVAA